MSKDQRVGRDLAEPDHHEERLWAAYLTFYREQLARAVLALTPTTWPSTPGTRGSLMS